MASFPKLATDLHGIGRWRTMRPSLPEFFVAISIATKAGVSRGIFRS
ncbi:hypothetical protein [Xanthobacter versatilis]